MTYLTDNPIMKIVDGEHTAVTIYIVDGKNKLNMHWYYIHCDVCDISHLSFNASSNLGSIPCVPRTSK
jgi:hypothetical protein